MPSRAPKTLRPQDEVSHYRVLAPLGAGGMGEVYLAQDLSLERRVALKILPPDLVRSEDRLRRFVLEAKSASSLSHPNIVTIYEIGSGEVRAPGEPDSSPVHFISMELVTGRTLASLIHEEKTDLKTLLGYFAQAAEGLAKAHAAGIVHRDLKPGNIMVSADGFAKVLDFGLAKLTEKQASGPETSSAATMTAEATGEGVIVGTAGYMSPEQVQGKSVDARSDIFSFGCMLYEAVTRHHPFRADTTIETLHRILNVTPVPVEELNPKVPADLRRLIRRCLAKNPDQRLQSMKDLALELREIVNDYDSLSASASSGSGSSGATTTLPAKRGPSRFALAIGAIALLGIAALVWWAVRQRGPGGGPQVSQDLEITPITNRGDIWDCVVSADGRYLAYLAGPPGQVSLRVRQVATGGDVEVLPATGAGIERPAFSPDGNYLFYLMRKPDAQNYRALYQIPSLGGSPQQKVFDVDSRATFSPDGRQVAFWRGHSNGVTIDLVIADLDSGKERVLADVPSAVFRNGDPSWSPDGKRIAAALYPSSGRVRTLVGLFDVTSGRRLASPDINGQEIQALAWLKDGSGLAAEGWATVATPNAQLFQISYPGMAVRRISNDFSNYRGVSTSAGDEAIASTRQIFISNIWIADVSGGPARPITHMANPDNSVFNAAAADTGTVLISASHDQGIQVWSLPAVGGAPTPLTSGPLLTMEIWAAAGKVAMNRVAESGIHVWSMNKDGSDLRQLTQGGGEQMLALSPDGQTVAYRTLDSLNTLRIVPAGGGPSRVIATNIQRFVGFSADGSRLLVSRTAMGPGGLAGFKLLASPASGGPPTDSLPAPGRAAGVKWSGDGRGIVFIDGSDPVHNLWFQHFGETTPTRLTSFTEGRVLDYLPSPDGTRLAIARHVGSTENVWVCNADGSHPVQVTQFSSERYFAAIWFPDSRRLMVGAGTQNADAVLVRKFR